MSGGETSKSTNQPTKKQHAPGHRKQKTNSPPPSLRNKRTKATRTSEHSSSRKVGPLSSSEPSTPKRIKKKEETNNKNPTRDTKLHARSLERFSGLHDNHSPAASEEEHLSNENKPRKTARTKRHHSNKSESLSVSSEKTASEITISEEEQDKDKPSKRHPKKSGDASPLKSTGSFTKKKRKKSQDQEKPRKDKKQSDEDQHEEERSEDSDNNKVEKYDKEGDEEKDTVRRKKSSAKDFLNRVTKSKEHKKDRIKDGNIKDNNNKEKDTVQKKNGSSSRPKIKNTVEKDSPKELREGKESRHNNNEDKDHDKKNNKSSPKQHRANPNSLELQEDDSVRDDSSDRDSSGNKDNGTIQRDKPKKDQGGQPKEKGGFLSRIQAFGKRKKKQQEQPKKEQAPNKGKQLSPRERHVIVARKVSDLSEDIQKKLKKSRLAEEQLNANFQILLNVLHFLTKDSYRMGDDKTASSPPQRKPYASVKLMEAAKAAIKIPDKDIKKIYRNIEFTGKGGFGKVFAAKHCQTKKRVAIKKLPHVNEKDRRNNYCEIGFLKTSDHLNIVHFIECFLVKDEVWIITEFLEGGTLSEAVKVHQFSERHIAYVCREILKALKYLHSIHFVHRDLKSGNVMMSIEGHIKLIDFGLCADISEGYRTQMLGSPFWMPPEMIHRQPHGEPADIWSFAVCVLEMYLKEPPNSFSRLKAMFTVAAEGIKSFIPPKASDDAKEFLNKCLEQAPEERSTAAELLEYSFVNQSGLADGIRDVLRGVFVSNSLALSGI